ncbi:biosynthetic-type acetolactate synthase large subunit [Pontibacter fetidus]|uniref:Acetolactate synthase n=1 Tax=Pontibacter fetidus TaxID=2700082 RepID=A0A6B2H5X9_9BACT|nr:biosynthetic-type acetolactate synthase large subunit [Pontibacter fetidus]NDK55717.1 biosynthetic-type acetolactate synthase large subunit [Pontibacter fetidus]
MESYTNTPDKLAVPQKAASPTAKSTCTGAEAVMRSLVAEGVETIFGYPGGAIMPIYDALYDFNHKVNHILVRHEQGATHAAEGYARASGKVGVVFATSGPGATNLITGLADALMDSVPMVCVVGQVSSGLLGTDAFQEANIMSVCAAVTKWNYQVTDADEVADAMAKAFYVARSGKPGPVVIEVTKDAQFAELKKPFRYTPVTQLPYYRTDSGFTRKNLQDAATLLNEAQRPLILAGNGVGIAGAETALLQLAEKTETPVACTLHGLSCISTSHTLYVGMLGMHGNYAPNLLTNQADVLLAVGMRFDDRVTGNLNFYAKQAKVIHIEIDPSELNKIVKADVPLLGDALAILEELTPLLNTNSHPMWLNEFAKLDAQEEEKVRRNALYPNKEKLTMPEVIQVLGEQTSGEAMVIADVGQHQMMAARYYPFRKRKSYFTSGGLGTMGFALPAALGAKTGAPDREIVAVIGDGCFQMTIQELATIAQYKVPVKVMVLNNNFLGMVRQWQNMFFDGRYSFVKMENPDFTEISKAFGIQALRVEKREDLPGAVQQMLQSEGPFLLNVLVENEENVFPMMPTGAAVDGMLLE